MAKINKVTIHITATPKETTVETIRKFHIVQGWSDCGYHWLVDYKGIIHAGRPETKTGAHVAGHNTGNIGISYISRGSDIEPDAPYGKFLTNKQARSLEWKVADILFRYKLETDAVYGHNDFDMGKACPCFKVRTATAFLDNVQAELDKLEGTPDDQPEMAQAEDGIDAEVSEEPFEATV